MSDVLSPVILDAVRRGGKWKSQVFTASGTWLRPSGVDVVELVVVGAGAGGGFGSASTYRAGGGGEIVTGRHVVSGDVSVVIGAGGPGAATVNTHGTNGGNSSFGSVVARGGFGNGIAGGATATHGRPETGKYDAFVSPYGATGGAGGVGLVSNNQSGGHVPGLGKTVGDYAGGASWGSGGYGSGYSWTSSFDAPPNTGGGGALCIYGSTATGYRGGKGADGIVFVYWQE